MRCTLGLVLGILFALLGACVGTRQARASFDAPSAEGVAASAAATAAATATAEGRQPEPSTRAEVDTFSRAVDAMPQGRTRAAADLFLGEIYRSRFGAADRAAKHLRRAASAPEADLDPLSRRIAEGALVDVLLTMGARGEAREVATRSGDPELGRRVNVVVRRHDLRIASLTAVGLFALFASVAVIVATKRRSLARATPALRRFIAPSLAFAAWLGATGALLARAYDDSNPLPFVALAFVIFPIAMAARAWGLLGRSSAWARAFRAAMAGQAALAAAFLVLETIDPRLLEGFGL